MFETNKETTNMQYTVTEIKSVWVYDGDADASYLEQPEFEDRLESFNRGEFYFEGCYALAELVSLSGVVQTIRSSGLWGIESDSDSCYKQEIEREQFRELWDELQVFEIFDTVAEFDKLAGIYHEYAS